MPKEKSHATIWCILQSHCAEPKPVTARANFLWHLACCCGLLYSPTSAFMHPCTSLVTTPKETRIMASNLEKIFFILFFTSKRIRFFCCPTFASYVVDKLYMLHPTLQLSLSGMIPYTTCLLYTLVWYDTTT